MTDINDFLHYQSPIGDSLKKMREYHERLTKFTGSLDFMKTTGFLDKYNDIFKIGKQIEQMRSLGGIIPMLPTSNIDSILSSSVISSFREQEKLFKQHENFTRSIIGNSEIFGSRLNPAFLSAGFQIENHIGSVFKNFDIGKTQSLIQLGKTVRALQSPDIAIQLQSITGLSSSFKTWYEKFLPDGEYGDLLSMPASTAFNNIGYTDDSIIFDGNVISRDDIETLTSNVQIDRADYSWLESIKGLDPNVMTVIGWILTIILFTANPWYDWAVKNYLDKTAKMARSEIKSNIKYLPIEVKSLCTNYRIVIEPNLKVFETPKQRARHVGYLPMGAKVEVCETRKDWTLIMFTDSESDVIIKGWVLTRYVIKIR